MLTRLLDAAARPARVAGSRVLASSSRRAAARALARTLRVLDRAAALAAAGAVVLLALAVRLVQTALTDVGLPLLVAAHRLAQDHVLPPPARLPASAPLAVGRRSGARELVVAGVAVLLVGVGAAAASTPERPVVRAVPAAHEEPQREPLAPAAAGADPGPARPEARAVPEEPTAAPSSTPPVIALTPSAPPQLPDPRTRWLPSGTGMWLHDWAGSEGGSAGAVVDRALASGFTHLYVQTGSTKKGWIGEEVLSELLPATQGTDLRVVAWDFPKLIDPEADALRMAAAATWSRPGVPRVAAVAPDVETPSEGTRLSADAVTRYYAALRDALPPEVAVLATVPWPSEKRTGSYPYAETAVLSDAFVPMAYWYNRSPTVVTDTSMAWLAQFGLPVMPVGQGYDGRIDAPYLAEDPDPAGSVQQFVDAARSRGAPAVSLWSWQTTPGPQWDVLARASALPWTTAVGVAVPDVAPAG